jgi:hypothetical protein
MSIRTAFSTKPLPDAVAELRDQVRGPEPRVVLFFASDGYDGCAISQQMQSAFPKACVVGCSTAGELSGGKMLTGSVSAMLLDDDVVEDAAMAVIDDLGGSTGVKAALARLEEHFEAPAFGWDIEKHVGLVLVDGLSGAEEWLMEEIGDATDVFFVGGSAGDDLKFKGTRVYAGGAAYPNGAVLVLLRLRGAFQIVKTQSFRATGRTLTATAVDELRRTVVEFDHKPALEAYAEALGVPPAEAAAQFFTHPLGLMVEGEPYVRSPQRTEDGQIVFYCQIRDGMELEVLEGTDIVADTRQALESSKAQGGIRGVIDFQCILRTLQLRHEKRCDQYGAIFKGIPMAGFSTYGEAYLGHLNQTSTILVLR